MAQIAKINSSLESAQGELYPLKFWERSKEFLKSYRQNFEFCQFLCKIKCHTIFDQHHTIFYIEGILI